MLHLVKRCHTMSNITREHAAELIARDKSGGDLSSAEWAALARFHASDAVRHAKSAVMYSRVGLVAVAVAVVFAVAARVVA